MPCPHNEISIVQRSQQQSAVAAAAYQSGEKLFWEYDQEVKHYPEKRGIVHNEILLPANAPQEYADRNTLWNAAEAVEKQWNSQLARRWVLTIPREILVECAEKAKISTGKKISQTNFTRNVQLRWNKLFTEIFGNEQEE